MAAPAVRTTEEEDPPRQRTLVGEREGNLPRCAVTVMSRFPRGSGVRLPVHTGRGGGTAALLVPSPELSS